MVNKDVFISYKAEEMEEAAWVKSVLESNGISCWMAPASIPGGSSYAVEIPQAIRGAKVFVLILSSKAQTSRWVSREIDLAINEGKIVLPFMLENCSLKDDFNFYLTNVQRYIAYENKAAAIEKMIREIKALTDGGKSEHEPEKINTEKPEEISSEKSEEISIENPEIESVTDESKAKYKYDIRSVLSLVFGAISFIYYGAFIVPNIVAVIFSFLGLKKMKTKVSNFAERVLIIAGHVLGLISLDLGMSIWLGAIGFIISLVLDIVSLVVFIKKYRALFFEGRA